MIILSTPTSAAFELRCALDRVTIPAFSLAMVAPENLDQLNSAVTSRMVIYAGHSEHTIFGHRWDNYRQRAHHDAVHLLLQADTSVSGERRVARHQCRDIERVSGSTIADILFADLFGQTLHMGKYGMFPDDQSGFIMDYLKTGLINKF